MGPSPLRAKRPDSPSSASSGDNTKVNKFVYLANRLALAVVLVSLLSLLTACSEKEKLPASKAFCQAAERYNNELQNAERLGEADVDRQLPIVQELDRTAPKKIKDDAETFANALKNVERNPSLKDNPKVQAAVDAVNRYANQACNVYKRDSGL